MSEREEEEGVKSSLDCRKYRNLKKKTYPSQGRVCFQGNNHVDQMEDEDLRK